MAKDVIQHQIINQSSAVSFFLVLKANKYVEVIQPQMTINPTNI